MHPHAYAARPPRWLASEPIAADSRLAPRSSNLPDLILRWLAEPDGPPMVEWVIDVAPGGEIRSRVRAGRDGNADLAVLSAAAEVPLADTDHLPERADDAPLLGVDLGGPVAWLDGGTRYVDGPMERIRWLAGQGLGMRWRLVLWALGPNPAAARLVAENVRRLPIGMERWDPRRSSADHAKRLLRAVPFALSVQPDRPLALAERILLEQAFERAFSAQVRLGPSVRAGLAENELAATLLMALATLRAESQDDREATEELARLGLAAG